jgi:hypothetical protein
VPRLETPPSSCSHLHTLLDGQGIGLNDCRLAIKLAPDGAVTPGKKTRDLGLPAWIQGFSIAGL